MGEREREVDTLGHEQPRLAWVRTTSNRRQLTNTQSRISYNNSHCSLFGMSRISSSHSFILFTICQV